MHYFLGPRLDSASVLSLSSKLWFMDTVFVTLPLTIYETAIKMALIDAHRNAGVILVATM